MAPGVASCSPFHACRNSRLTCPASCAESGACAAGLCAPVAVVAATKKASARDTRKERWSMGPARMAAEAPLSRIARAAGTCVVGRMRSPRMRSGTDFAWRASPRWTCKHAWSILSPWLSLFLPSAAHVRAGLPFSRNCMTLLALAEQRLLVPGGLAATDLDRVFSPADGPVRSMPPICISSIRAASRGCSRTASSRKAIIRSSRASACAR